jgi:hypothetical protein
LLCPSSSVTATTDWVRKAEWVKGFPLDRTRRSPDPSKTLRSLEISQSDKNGCLTIRSEFRNPSTVRLSRTAGDPVAPGARADDRGGESDVLRRIDRDAVADHCENRDRQPGNCDGPGAGLEPTFLGRVPNRALRLPAPTGERCCSCLLRHQGHGNRPGRSGT